MLRRKMRLTTVRLAALVLLVIQSRDSDSGNGVLTVDAFTHPRPALTGRRARPSTTTTPSPSSLTSSTSRCLTPADFTPQDLDTLFTSSYDAIASSSSTLIEVLKHDSTVTSTVDLAATIWSSSKEVIAGTSADLYHNYGWILQDDRVAPAVDAASSMWIASAQTSSNLLDAYGELLRKSPLATKSITAGFLACVGDAIAQWRSEAEEYDTKRGLAFLIFGALYTGAFQHVWFSYLSDHISEWGAMLGIWGPERVALPVGSMVDLEEWWSYFDIVAQIENPPSPAALAIGKLFVNQFGMVPLFYMPLFFMLTGALGNLDLNASIARARSLYFQLLKRNYFFWLPVQFVQFLVLPPEWQIPFLSAASLVWTVILSSIGGGSSEKEAQIVAYGEEELGGKEIVTVMQVDPGAANEVTDYVSLRDVENALIPENIVGSVKEALSDGKVGAVSGGFALGLLASAADDGLIGAAVGSIIQGEVGAGIAIVTAVGAGVGFLTSANQAAGLNVTKVSDLDEDIQSLSMSEDDNVKGTVDTAVGIGMGMLAASSAAAHNLPRATKHHPQPSEETEKPTMDHHNSDLVPTEQPLSVHDSMGNSTNFNATAESESPLEDSLVAR